MGESDENQSSGSNHLLKEILDVLKRIDGHLEAQDSRISVLDARVRALSSIESSESQKLGISKEVQGPVDGKTSPLTVRTENPPPTSLRSKPHDFRALLSTEGGSLSKRGRQTSVTSHQSRWSTSSSKRQESSKSTLWGSPSQGIISAPKTTTISRTATWHSIPPPSTTAESQSIEVDDDPTYSQFPPPADWITTRSLGRALDVRYGSDEAKALWTKYVGDSWTIPPDGRIEMTFQQHLLERLDKERAKYLLQTLSDVSNRLEYQNSTDSAKRGSFRVTDFGFDPNFEESAAEYRAEVLTGKYRKHQIWKPTSRSSAANVIDTAPWKRMIEVRGLSKMLIDEHETWTQNFRNPWTEALPIVNSVLPFLTDRDNDRNEKRYTGMNAVNQALLYHQFCMWQMPQNDDCFTFHVTFYEVVELTNDDELDDEIWRSGRLHSDSEKDNSDSCARSRRIRESACTIVVVPDWDLRYWTSVYLCPNNFDLYDKSAKIIIKQDAPDIFQNLIAFTLRMVVERWSDIASYFARLIGHRDMLSDPDAHDSLLFDDDTFSRSRKYFWAINYLAELDVSISENIVQFDKLVSLRPIDSTFSIAARLIDFADAIPLMKGVEQSLEQLNGLKEKLRAQREEAIALRDGLFSASGVMESRASTRLGENIKLLTFVSIFFLPLSFCMSIWSVNNTIFSLKALLIVVILVGLGTYLVVFNLNNMVNLSSRLYDKHKENIIAQMKSNPDNRWRDEGKRFATFRPKQESLKPSEWLIGLFILHRLAMRFSLKVLFTRKRKEARRTNSGVEDEREWPEAHQEGEDPPKIQKMQIREKAAAKSAPFRWRKMLRRDALSPTVEQHV